MTEIAFHFNVPSRTGYACRLIRKAVRSGTPVAVTGPEDALAELDRDLWSFEADAFVPHARADRVAAVPAALHASTVWLAEDAALAPSHDVLVNVGAQVPRGFEAYRRLVEIVTANAGDRAAARERWKAYAGRGYPIASHQIGEGPA